MTKIIRTTEESGRSMVEMLGVLAIVGVLSIGGIAGYSKAMAKYKINKTLDQLSMIITNIRTTFGNQSSYRGLTTANAITYEIVGNDLTQGSTSKITNAFNDDVTLAALQEDNSTECGEDDTYCPAFKITFEGLPKTACGVVASSDWGGTASSGLVSIKIGETAHTWGGTNKLPIDYATAMSECTGANDSNTIEWI